MPLQNVQEPETLRGETLVHNYVISDATAEAARRHVVFPVVDNVWITRTLAADHERRKQY